MKAACGESLNVTPFHPVCLRKTLSLRLLRCTRAAKNASHWAFNKKKPVHLWRILISGAESYRKRLEFISTTQWGQITSLCLNCVCDCSRSFTADELHYRKFERQRLTFQRLLGCLWGHEVSVLFNVNILAALWWIIRRLVRAERLCSRWRRGFECKGETFS